MLEAGLYNMDCLEGMKEFPDGYFDLAIVDPPYGDGKSAAGGGVRWKRFGGWFNRYMTGPQGPEDAGAGNTAKKSSRGTRPREKNTSTSFSGSHANRSYGAGTTSSCPPRGASSYGTRQT